MKELIEVVDAHFWAAFMIGAFAVLGLSLVCRAAVRAIHGYRECDCADEKDDIDVD